MHAHEPRDEGKHRGTAVYMNVDVLNYIINML